MMIPTLTPEIDAPVRDGGSIYIVLTDFGDGAPGNACDPQLDFDDAVDVFAEQMGEGRASRVYCLMPGAGLMEDATDAAVRHLCRRLTARFDEWPEWLVAATEAHRRAVA